MCIANASARTAQSMLFRLRAISHLALASHVVEPYLAAVPALAERRTMFLLRPIFERDALELVRLSSLVADAARKPSWPAVRRHCPPIPISNHFECGLPAH